MPKTYIPALEKLNEEQRAEYWACLALRYGKNIGVRSTAHLIKHFGSAYEAVHNTAKWGETKAGSQRAAHINDNSWRLEAKTEWENARDLNADIILWNSPKYPELLKEIPDPPSFFYGLGNTDLLTTPSVAIVGSRDASREGEQLSADIARSLAHKGITVVSGMARGIDKAAHHGALKEIGSSIGVLGNGIDVLYPPKNDDTYALLQEKGLLISEFAPGSSPNPANFPIRNRIISGLSMGILVVEAGLKSGSRITAKLALEQNRTVFAVPGAVHSPQSAGCQELIRQGAKAVFHVKDILEDLFPLLKAEMIKADIALSQEPVKKPVKVPHSPKKLTEKSAFPEDSVEYALLNKVGKNKIHIDVLCQELDIPAGKLLALLTKLEFSEHIVRHEGGWISL